MMKTLEKNNKKIILAFSGGLDTTFCALYLKNEGYDVITLTVDTGGFSKKELQHIEKQAKKIGVNKHIFLDAKKELYTKFITYLIKGNVLRGGIYPLCVGPERNIIVEKLAKIAEQENAVAVAHGSTGAGNDQIRFDVALQALIPQVKILTPIRDLAISRDEEINILQKHHIEIAYSSHNYSINNGLIGTTIGGKETSTSHDTLPEKEYPHVTPIEQTPNVAEKITISFFQGLPIMINGKKMQGVTILQLLNTIGGKHGVGKGIHLGNTILGIKGRVGFEAPGITILIKAHTELEKLVLTKWQLFWKEIVCNAYGNFIHESLYFDPIVKNLEDFIDSTQQIVTGEVTVKLFKGNIIIEGYKSSYSLMDTHVATYGEKNNLWTGEEVKGFSKIYGLQSMLAYKRHKTEKGK